jgi:hypothetical protein
VADYSISGRHPHASATDSVVPVVVAEVTVERGVEKRSELLSQQRRERLSGRRVKCGHSEMARLLVAS